MVKVLEVLAQVRRLHQAELIHQGLEGV